MRYPFNMTRSDIERGPQMNYRQVQQALSEWQAFRHGDSMAGGWDATGTTYYVFSYETCIAWVNVWGEHWFNPERYSVTTSRQMGIVRAHLTLIRGELSTVDNEC